MRFLIVSPGGNDHHGLARQAAHGVGEQVAHVLQEAFDNAEVVTADGFDAYRDALDTGGADLIVTDYPLGWSDGFAMLREARERLPGVPVMMVTGAGSESLAVEGMKAGLSDYIPLAQIERLPDAIRAGVPDAIRVGVPDLVRTISSSATRAELHSPNDAGAGVAPAAQPHILLEALDSASTPMAYIDAGLIVRYCNREAARHWGRPRDGIVGRHLHEVLPDASGIRSAVERVVASGEPFETVTRLARTDCPEVGELVWRITYQPHRDEGGRVVGCLQQGQEMTDLVRAQEARENAVAQSATLEAELSAMLNALPNGLMLHGPRGEILQMNAVAEQQFGYSPEQKRLSVFERTATLAMQWENGLAVRAPDASPVARALAGETVRGVVMSWKSPPGADRRWYLVSAAPVRGVEGNIAGAVSAFTDITERQGMLEEAEERAAELNAVLTAIADGVVVYGPQGEIRRLNAAAQQFLAYSGRQRATPFEERGRWFRLHRPDGSEYAATEVPVARALNGDTVRAEVIRYAPRTTKAPAWMSVSAAPIRRPDGRVTGAVATLTNVTELLETQLRLITAQEQLEEQTECLEEQAAELQVQTDELQAQNDKLTGLTARLEFERERLATILESLGEGFVSIDRTWRFTYVNAMAEQVFGHTRDVMLGEEIWEFTSALWATMEPLKHAMDGATPVTFETPASSYHEWFEVRAYALPGGLAIFFRDVTARKHAEAERERLLAENRRQRAHLEAVLAQLPSGVIIVDVPSRRIVLSNAQAEELWQRGSASWDTVDDLRTSQRFHPNGRPYMQEEWPLMRSAERGEVIIGEEIDIVRPDGTRRVVRVSSSPIVNAQGEIASAVSVFVDVTLHRTLERQLQREHELLQTIYDSIPVMLTVYDPGLKKIELSAHVHRVTGWTPADVAETPIIELAYPDPEHREEAAAYMRSLVPGYRDFEMVAKSGEVIQTSWANIQLADGRRIGIGIDITERKRAERVLLESRERLAWVLKNTGVGVWLNEVPFGKLHWDDQMRELFYVEPGTELTLDWLWSRVHPDDVEPIRSAVDTALRDGALHALDHRVVSPETGEVRWLRSIGQAVYSADGTLTRLDGISFDITESKRAEQALRDSEALYRAIARNFPDGAIYIFDHDLRFLVADGDAMAMVGYSREGLEGRTIWESTAPETYQLLEQRCPRVLAGESLHFDTSHRGRAFSSSYVPVRDDQDRIIAGMVVSHDITERIRAEDALRHYAGELEQANQANQLLLREVNHRVKNNLTAILGLIFAEQRRLSHPQGEPAGVQDDACLSRCRMALEDLSERVRSLATAHGLLSAGGWRALQLDDLVSEVIGASVLAADDPDALSLSVEGAEVVVTPDQAHHLALIIGELATNTAKYGRGAGGLRVRVDIELEDTMVRLVYRDHGPGYPAQVLAGKGRSIGLGLVNTIMSISLRGSWSVSNGDGAVIELRFPVANRLGGGLNYE